MFSLLLSDLLSGFLNPSFSLTQVVSQLHNQHGFGLVEGEIFIVFWLYTT